MIDESIYLPLWRDTKNFSLVWCGDDFIIYNHSEQSIFLIDDDIIAYDVINKMLSARNDIYTSIDDCLNRKNAIELLDYTKIIERYRGYVNVSVKWSSKQSMATQITRLKEMCPQIKNMCSSEILSIAEKERIWNFISIPRLQAYELINEARNMGLELLIKDGREKMNGQSRIKKIIREYMIENGIIFPVANGGIMKYFELYPKAICAAKKDLREFLNPLSGWYGSKS